MATTPDPTSTTDPTRNPGTGRPAAPAGTRRDRVAALFAAALDGDTAAHHQLAGLAATDPRAARAHAALPEPGAVDPSVGSASDPGEPAADDDIDIPAWVWAYIDQMQARIAETRMFAARIAALQAGQVVGPDRARRAGGVGSSSLRDPAAGEPANGPARGEPGDPTPPQA